MSSNILRSLPYSRLKFPMTTAGSPSEILASLTPARAIPQNWRESASHWWSSTDKESEVAQERLLRRLPFFSSSPQSSTTTPHPDPSTGTSTSSLASKVIGRVSRYQLDSPKRFLNQFAITPIDLVENKGLAPPPTVVLHGYGAGLGFFFLNFQALGEWAAKRGGSIYALDWLGMGLSARVPFKVHAKREDTEQRVKEAEDFFLDALEEWRSRNGFDKINLIGHSLGGFFARGIQTSLKVLIDCLMSGGYLSVAYALRYPERVTRVILLSPAGIPRDPNAVDAAIQQAAAADTQADREAGVKKDKEISFRRKLVIYAWEAGFSPFQVVRSASMFGPLLVARVSEGLFPF